MRRHRVRPRPEWQHKVEEVGLTYHSLDGGQPYWDESAYWEFSAAEVDRIESATAELQRLCLAAGDFILDHGELNCMRIPEEAAAAIRESWKSEPPALYGRMDLAYDGTNLKLLEYNADTPTVLVESAVAQWYWLEEAFPSANQFNSIHERLVEKWKDLAAYVSEPIYFGYEPCAEDHMTISYLRDTAHQAGLASEEIAMQRIGWAAKRRCFVDISDRPTETIFKLYPWEKLLCDAFGQPALATLDSTQWIEPIWKMLWSNKALLAILWQLFPGHELLLPAYLDGPRDLTSWVRKPLLGREGSNVSVSIHGITMESTPGDYAAGGFVYQQFAELATDGAVRAVIGSWLVDGEPCGIGIRESDGYVTTNTSRFVPHLFRS